MADPLHAMQALKKAIHKERQETLERLGDGKGQALEHVGRNKALKWVLDRLQTELKTAADIQGDD